MVGSVSRDPSHGLKHAVEPLKPMFLLIVPTLKSAELREGGLANASVQVHPNILPSTFIFIHSYMTPSCPIRGSVSVPSVDLSRGSSPPGKDVGTGVSIPTQVPLPSVACQVAQSSGEIRNVPVGPAIVATTGLNAAQAEEIFLLSREVQALRGKLALDFIHIVPYRGKLLHGCPGHQPQI